MIFSWSKFLLEWKFVQIPNFKWYSCRYKRNVERLTATGAENKLSQVKFRNIASQNSSENYFHFVLKNWANFTTNTVNTILTKIYSFVVSFFFLTICTVL